MSIFNKKDYINDTVRVVGKKDNRIVMKRQKLPSNMKTKYSICPICSKKGYIKKKKFCKICKFKFTPEKGYTYQVFTVKSKK